MAATNNEEPPFVGGSQPVEHKPDPMPQAGRSGAQVVVIAIAVIAIVAGIAWVVVPILGGR